MSPFLMYCMIFFIVYFTHSWKILGSQYEGRRTLHTRHYCENKFKEKSFIPEAPLPNVETTQSQHRGLLKRSFQAAAALTSIVGLYLTNLNIVDTRTREETISKLFRTFLRENMNVLEVGFGSGFGANIMFYPSNVSLTALDPNLVSNSYNDATVEYSKQYINLKSMTVGSCEALPFEDSSFDAVVCTLVLCTVKDPQLCLREIARVLKPGGVFLCVEHIIADEEGVDQGNINLTTLGVDTNKLFSRDKISLTPTVPSDTWLAFQQRALDPLQQLVADGCHLNRHTDKLLVDASRSPHTDHELSFSELCYMHYDDLPSQWPISRQVFACLRK